MTTTSTLRKTALLTSLLVAVPAIFAQDGQTPPPPPPGNAAQHGHAPGQPGPGGQRGERRDGQREGQRDGGPGGPMGLLPPGTWWRDAKVVAAVGLSPDQQKRIDDTFLQSRVKLIDLHAALEKEQLMMEPLLSANPVDQGRTLAQISKIADTRAELEKADAKMLLSIRGVLTADQWTKLQATHRGRMGGPGGDGGGRGQGGPHGPRGNGPMPQGPGAQPGPAAE